MFVLEKSLMSVANRKRYLSEIFPSKYTLCLHWIRHTKEYRFSFQYAASIGGAVSGFLNIGCRNAIELNYNLVLYKVFRNMLLYNLTHSRKVSLLHFLYLAVFNWKFGYEFGLHITQKRILKCIRRKWILRSWSQEGKLILFYVNDVQVQHALLFLRFIIIYTDSYF